ncbi:hypothetical protein FVR03_02825 [Pontibacter qinzhouensis]|uniref:DUF4625 domain-containing protein n=1 Tax=Pontibacter qinzhouensis TaxID=2603253 RepID=A0A5C8KA13_9BACT|nr:hypothetical protein [Pontibacter qinzhouensis]TXK51885.1 hypothetical protein FVR03_02825 [Pontibacter qinzhouensis]
MKFNALLAAIVALLCFTACEDIFEDKNAPDGSKPEVRVLAPTSSRSYAIAEGLPIKLSVIDKDEIKELKILVKGSYGEPDLINFSKYPDVKVLELDTIVGQQQFAPGTYTLEITATDHRSNIASKEVSFKIKNQ